jgi:hypothetical protein
MLGLGIGRPLQDELDVGGPELAPVVEAHTLLEEERVVLAVGGVPAVGQPRHELAVLVYLDQALLDIVVNDGGDGGGGAGREVEAGRLRGHLHGEIALGCGGSHRAGRHHGQENQKRQEPAAPHGHRVPSVK